MPSSLSRWICWLHFRSLHQPYQPSPYTRRVGIHIPIFETSRRSFTLRPACSLKPFQDPSSPKASAASLPPHLLRLLPVGAFTGWISHPLDDSAFPRRTGILRGFVCAEKRMPVADVARRVSRMGKLLRLFCKVEPETGRRRQPFGRGVKKMWLARSDKALVGTPTRLF